MSSKTYNIYCGESTHLEHAGKWYKKQGSINT